MPPTPTHSPVQLIPRAADWRGFFAPGPAAAVIDAGSAGELVVARVRIALMGAIAFVPLVSMYGAKHVGVRENLSALVTVLAGLVVSAAILVLARRNDRHRRLAIFTSAFDVSLVSVTQLAYLLQDFPSAAANSRTTFVAYFMAVGATCLRWDVRITLFAGMLAIVEYSAIAVLAWARWPAIPTPDVLVHGEFVWGHQMGRVVFLIAFTVMCAAIVRQSVQLRISSTHDALTRLMNRAFFEERLRDELSRAARTHSALCVALLDIDHFKRVNDEHGHDAGDAALQVVASVLRRAVRRNDLIARWGGEEFALAFPDTRLPEAFGKLEQLRLEVASHTIVLPSGAQLRLTASAGLATLGDDGADLRTLLQAADQRLLEAKRSGRNRVSMTAPTRPQSGGWRVVVAS
ncbi:MAG: GGDEF domain-containing protein [Gemmatimonadetes bacterium]|jgi:two-component system cell cycle response regulator|nr:GGDEF domain-containing protein [Gemmatimonadota bacterium]MBP9105305.1 GGDEF domain-containing protein [Gemmatimonadaceae bacterium]MBK8645923.1 GGDEF domain-containing protein [Gemmatimonadota bacterium]MBK9407941.1 GGDEF domain-containing protein [Gemmatimonadota bacterium]MBK9979038.1 GGDEF domain-containing protein [Gemmatimonadota bacterium]